MALFGKKKDEVRTPAVSGNRKGTTLFGGNLTVVGTVSGDDDLHVMGTAEGVFDLKGNLQIGRSAKVKGEAAASDIDVSGRMEGSLTASSRIHLGGTARIKGAMNTPKLSVSEGAVFDGEVHMKGGDGASSPAGKKKIS